MRLTSPGWIVWIHLTLDQIGERGEADMRMRSRVDAFASAEDGGTESVEEDEGADHPALGRRQSAADFEATEVANCRQEHLLDLRCVRLNAHVLSSSGARLCLHGGR
jgi:hypothetical protein